MVKILMHGCNGKMGRMITEIVKNEEDAVIAAGVSISSQEFQMIIRYLRRLHSVMWM